MMTATAGLSLLGLYILWRAWNREPLTGWLGWLTRDWAPRSPRLCRWLTGDFVT
jgi:hypothetical protein